MCECCFVGLVDLQAKLVECRADHVKVSSSMLSCDFLSSLSPKGGKGRKGRES